METTQHVPVSEKAEAINKLVEQFRKELEQLEIEQREVVQGFILEQKTERIEQIKQDIRDQYHV